jgi:uncharacterized repeat protein (TIGR03943 family)
MKATQQRVAGWVPFLVFGAWAGAFVYLLTSFRYMAFLRPEFGLLLAAALIIALGFSAACLPKRGGGEMSGSVLMRRMVLLLPVLYLILIPHETLKSNSFKTRFVGVSGLGAARGADGADYPALSDPVGSGERDQTILSLYREAEHFQGRRVAFTGMVLRDETLKPYFGGRSVAVYRFLISCCVADAMPLAISVDEELVAGLANDKWVRVEGIFRVVVVDGNPVPLIEDGSVTPIDKPGFPYLL